MTALAKPRRGRVVALSGGVGGARLAAGLAAVLGGELSVVVNVGDDFEHWGLAICPDLDTVMYTLAGLSHDERGWGLAEESFQTFEMVRRYGGAGWFQLGDRDLATHLVRTEALARGATLTEVSARLSGALGIEARILPMADRPCRTRIETAAGETLSFQEWLVERRAPPVRRVYWEGETRPAPSVIPAIAAADLVLIGPSNPYVSIDPILRLDGVREALARKPVVAVSPIVGGKAIKGPLGEMIPALARDERVASSGAIARHYGGLLAGFVVERGDEAGVDLPAARVLATSTVMRERGDRRRLALEVLAFAGSLAGLPA